MTPAKEKANELIHKFKPLCKDVKHTGVLDGLATVMSDDVLNHFAAKQCALIAVGEVLDKDGYNNHYWREVKQEIESL